MKLLALLALSTFTKLVAGAPCWRSTFAGEFDVTNQRNDVEGRTGIQVIGSDLAYTFGCCGLIKRWQVIVEPAGAVQLEVWRPSTGGTPRTLVWSYVAKVPNEHSVFTASMSNTESKVIQPGDVIGWFGISTEVMYDHNDARVLHGRSTQAAVGELAPSSLTGLQRDYAIRADIDPPQKPQIATSATSITKTRPELPVGGVVFTFTVTDTDGGDTVNVTALFTASDMLAMSIDGSSNGSYVVGAIKIQNRPTLGTHSLNISAKDLCGVEETEVFSVVVTNTPPVEVSLPNSVYVSEDNSASVLLHTLTSSDPDGDPVTCSYTGPHTDKFEVRDSGIYLMHPVALEASVTDTYILDVTCTDGLSSVTGQLSVLVLPNARPVLTDLPGNTTISSKLGMGSVVYNVTATDAENDFINFELSCQPEPCPFAVYQSGSIRLEQSLITNTHGAFVANITVCDARRCSSKPLTIYVTDLQSAPIIWNLPASVSVAENQNDGDFLHSLSITDANGDTTFTFHMNVTPPTVKFTLDDICRCIKLGANETFDYEKDPTSFNVTVMVSDEYFSSLPKTLTVHVIDVNEAPVLSTSRYVISHPEDKAGTKLPRPAYALWDPDTGDSHSYWLVEDANSPLLSLDPLTGTPSFTIDYDVDNPGRPSVLTFQVEIRDSGGLSTTATVTLSVTDVNDNAPDCGESLYVTSLAREATLGSQVFSHTVTDADSGVNARLSYSVQHPRGIEAVLGVRGQGQLYLHSSLSSLPQDSFNVTVTATDGGSPPLSCSYGLLVEINTVTQGFLELNMNWFVPFLMLLMLSGGLAAVLMVRRCCQGCCEKGGGRRKWRHGKSDKRAIKPHVPHGWQTSAVKLGLDRGPRVLETLTPTDVTVQDKTAVWDLWNSSSKF